MKFAAPMRLELFGNADFPILSIDENDVFMKHRWIIPHATLPVSIA
jgi:hypothetical protein